MDRAAVALESRPKLAPRVRLQTDAVSQQPVLLYPEGILELNDTAHEIAHRCDGTKTTAEIIETLAAEYDARPEDLQSDVLQCLADLHCRQLIVLTET
jgi:pyrroloquinoline quinone biosynthesis protein D